MGPLCAEADKGRRAPLTPLAAVFLRYASDRLLLTKPNTSCTIEDASVATLRSDGIRDHPGMPFGFIVRLRRNPHPDYNSDFVQTRFPPHLAPVSPPGASLHSLHCRTTRRFAIWRRSTREEVETDADRRWWFHRVLSDLSLAQVLVVLTSGFSLSLQAVSWVPQLN